MFFVDNLYTRRFDPFHFQHRQSAELVSGSPIWVHRILYKTQDQARSSSAALLSMSQSDHDLPVSDHHARHVCIATAPVSWDRKPLETSGRTTMMPLLPPFRRLSIVSFRRQSSRPQSSATIDFSMSQTSYTLESPESQSNGGYVDAYANAGASRVMARHAGLEITTLPKLYGSVLLLVPVRFGALHSVVYWG